LSEFSHAIKAFKTLTVAARFVVPFEAKESSGRELAKVGKLKQLGRISGNVYWTEEEASTEFIWGERPISRTTPIMYYFIPI
jgi:hypothetical protein